MIKKCIKRTERMTKTLDALGYKYNVVLDNGSMALIKIKGQKDDRWIKYYKDTGTAYLEIDGKIVKKASVESFTNIRDLMGGASLWRY